MDTVEAATTRTALPLLLAAVEEATALLETADSTTVVLPEAAPTTVTVVEVDLGVGLGMRIEVEAGTTTEAGEALTTADEVDPACLPSRSSESESLRAETTEVRSFLRVPACGSLVLTGGALHRRAEEATLSMGRQRTLWTRPNHLQHQRFSAGARPVRHPNAY